MFDRERIQDALRVWRSETGVRPGKKVGPCERRLLLDGAIGTTFDQLAADLTLIEQSESLLDQGARRLGQPLHEITAALALDTMAGRGGATIGRRRHVIPDSVLRALRSAPTDADRAEDDEIAYEISDAIVEDHERGDAAARLDAWRTAERAAIASDESLLDGSTLRRRASEARAAFHAAEDLQRRRHGYERGVAVSSLG